MANITWSYSSLALYQQCPKKYYHLKVAKDVVDPPGEAILFGNTIHKIAEKYIVEGAPIPEKHKAIEPALASIRATMSSSDQSRSVIPAAIAGDMRSVLWMRQKL